MSLPSRFFVFALAAVLLVGGPAGCGGLFGSDPEPVTPEAPEPPRDTAESEPDPPQDSVARPVSLLERAEERFEAGDYREAESLFVRYLESGSVTRDGQTDRALWGLAMVNLLPESPIRDRDRAMVALDRLVLAHGGTVRGAQARWVRSLLQELEEIRTQVDQQEQLLRQLTETVEQLRRIDLNRRPPRPPPDTVPAPSPGGR